MKIPLSWNNSSTDRSRIGEKFSAYSEMTMINHMRVTSEFPSGKIWSKYMTDSEKTQL